MEACREGGVYFGIYVSIIDKHFESAGSDKYPDYGTYYYEQLKELSTNYGPIDEYWFDGYQADELKMNYKKIAELIKKNLNRMQWFMNQVPWCSICLIEALHGPVLTGESAPIRITG